MNTQKLLKLQNFSFKLNLQNKQIFSFSAVELLEKDRVAYITLNNAKKRNPLQLEVIKELGEKLEILKQSYENRNKNLKNFPKCIVIKSEGPVFSAGHDLKEVNKNSKQENYALFNKCSQVMAGIQKHPLPVVASVQGLATAAGCQLVAACDMAVGTESSRYQTPGIKIGLFCTTPAVSLIRSLSSKKKAMEMLCTGDPISAQEAYNLGLINQIVKDDKLEEETLEFVKRIIVHSSETIALGKQAFYKQSAMENLDEAYGYATEKMVENLQQEDCKEGIQSFVEKRHPHFKY
ncbi:hypothetical protein PPERSA_02557 [Pseudocohnilembus persalinus]|uniref:Enoyl-CoA hydratase domain-containing protein 3, mitochondrial n=1 Tax=Pseudocohnilembus persalinus TaxID=266149 RepID=A0A0V0R641_PSEPJ|nr:hypothetical protein PPERSA_02557 [Pseudocohnilembus persalinus]|eukprot:KRX09685.1 hypothetical protein PPERSA_02557 [Pseudocohnilembus persalinus]